MNENKIVLQLFLSTSELTYQDELLIELNEDKVEPVAEQIMALWEEMKADYFDDEIAQQHFWQEVTEIVGTAGGNIIETFQLNLIDDYDEDIIFTPEDDLIN